MASQSTALSQLFSLSRAHARAGRHGDAEKLLRRILKRHSRNFEALLALGHLRLRLGDGSQAAEYLRRALAVDNTHAPTHNNLGNILKSSGKLDDAISAYRLALKFNPDYAEAYNNLGATLLAQAKHLEAVAACERALELKPSYVAAHVNLGLALRALGRIDDSIAAYKNAVKFKPDLAQAHSNLGTAYQELGRLPEAIAAHKRATEIEPENHQILNNLGTAQLVLGDPAAAKISFERAIALKPDFAEAHNNLGNVLKKDGKLDESRASYERAIALRPKFAQAHSNLGTVFQDQKNLAEAVACYERAIEFKPDYPDAYNNIGVALKEQGKLLEATSALERAVSIKPSYFEAHSNLGNVWLHRGNITQAIASYDRALDLKPEYIQASFNKSLALLLSARFDQGWPLYENRYHKNRKEQPIALPRVDCPKWQGQSLGGRKLLLIREQGLGDQLQFLRYASLLAKQAAEVDVVVHPGLVELARSVAGVGRVLTKIPNRGRDYDFWSFMLSVPLWLRTDIETIPAQIPYLFVSREKIVEWARRIDAVCPAGLRVGLVWAGSKTHRNDHNRSLSLFSLVPLLRMPGISFLSFQKEDRNAEQRSLGDNARLVDLGSGFGDFSDTAAALMNVDLLISVDTSVAHLAGALGRPVWTMIPFGPDWRWLLDREDSPWYPTMRLFRQAQIGQWEDVVSRIARSLDAMRLAKLKADVSRDGAALGRPAVQSVGESVQPTPVASSSIRLVSPQNALVEGRHGIFLADRNESKAGQALIDYGEYGEIEWRRISSFCKPGDNVVEIGANIGAHTVAIGKHVAPGRVLAIESRPYLFNYLCANIALNSLRNVDAVNARCGAKDEMRGKSDGLARPEAGLRQVPNGRLDDFVALESVRLLKIRADGSETEVLAGARRLIERAKPVLYVQNERPDRSENLIGLLWEWGYRLWWHLPQELNAANFFRSPVTQSGHTTSINMLGIHRSQRIDVDRMTEIIDAKLHPRRDPRHARSD